jgi:hypothetical protein
VHGTYLRDDPAAIGPVAQAVVVELLDELCALVMSKAG